MKSQLLSLCSLVLSLLPVLAKSPEKELPLPGEVFMVAGHTGFLIPAKSNAITQGKPWVWYAPTLKGLPGKEERWMFERFLEAGISIAGLDVGESFGSPKGNELYSQFHKAMSTTRNFSEKPVLLGRSRGGLMTLSWATENPTKVAAFAGIYPVCNLSSYPGIPNAAGAFAMKPEALLLRLKEFNPIDKLAGLAKAGVPLFAIHGDVDTVVPLEANSGLMKDRYRALGGTMELVLPKGQGHNMWSGFFESKELVEFVKTHAHQRLMLSSPVNYQVIQRSTKSGGTIPIRGHFTLFENSPILVEARVIVPEKPSQWRQIAQLKTNGPWEGFLEAPAGGWYRLEIRAMTKETIVAQAVVHPIGIGEVFVVAGQSNSANYGEQRLKPKSERVVALGNNHWQYANDPQPGASGDAGSFLPPFGDRIQATLNVPVGLVSCGVGATSVREWLPKGQSFPHPPTLLGNVKQLGNGDWESKGDLFETLCLRMKQLGPNGFRAVLWHQGESDANQADPTRTLPGKSYRKFLEMVIQKSRKKVGWEVPWFVAQATYHVPGDESSPDIRDAQSFLWKNGIALEGPDTDSLKGLFRSEQGKGVHFSAKGQQEHAALWAEKVTPWLKDQLKEGK